MSQVKKQDQLVLKHYQTIQGSTAYIASLKLKLEREDVSKSLQRLKRQGLMRNDGSYWKIGKPEALGFTS